MSQLHDDIDRLRKIEILYTETIVEVVRLRDFLEKIERMGGYQAGLAAKALRLRYLT